MDCCGLSSTGLNEIDISSVTNDLLLAINNIYLTNINNRILILGSDINNIMGLLILLHQD